MTVHISPLVSVVVTTKNEAHNIRYCLESIKLQTYSNLELIVVDNYSSDQTVEIASEFTDKLFLHGPERSAQRNYGMRVMARGSYLMYVDADMILSPILLSQCVASIKKTNDVALYVPEIILGNKYFCTVRRFERHFYQGTIIDGARFFDAKTFDSVGGFDEELFRLGSGEDWDLDKKIREVGGISLVKNTQKERCIKWPLKDFIEARGVQYEDDLPCVYHNESNFNVLKYIRKKSYYAKGFSGYIVKWGSDDPDIKKQFSLMYRFFYVFLENKKWKKFLSKPNLLIGLYFLRVMVGLAFLRKKILND